MSIAVAAASCATSNSSQSVSTPTTSVPSTTSPLPLSNALPSGTKAPLTGLVDMGSQRFYLQGSAAPTLTVTSIPSNFTALSGIVVNSTWGQLEPSKGSYDWSTLDDSLAAVTSWNETHTSTPLAVKLRVFGGLTAPVWAKSLGGAPLSDGARSIGRWWTPEYESAWSTFQHALAARYDSNALIRAVAVTSCASLTGEPFITAMNAPALAVLEPAGWTPAAQQNCIDGIFNDYSGWHETQVDFPFNTFRTLVNGVPVNDTAVTISLMEACASSAAEGGIYCVMGNHGLEDTAGTTTASAPVYSEIDTLWQQTPGHVPVYFQTVGPTNGADCTSINNAIAHHASSVELWPEALAELSTSTLQSWDTALTSGASLQCS